MRYFFAFVKIIIVSKIGNKNFTQI